MKIFGLNIARKKRPGTAAKTVRLGLPRVVPRSYDAAATNRHNQNHWLYADARDADSLIRQSLPTLRNRARYEVRNNSYAKGILETKANDLVGTGPRLQIQTDDPEFDHTVEDRFSQWSNGCDMGGKMSLAEILRLAGSLQQDESGESFIIMQSAKTKQRAIRLRLLVVEPDRVQTPLGLFGSSGFNSEKIRDGIEVDEYGRPVNYYILKKHPGSTYSLSVTGEYDTVPASQVIHLYRQDRPGQSRGVPWITPAIPLFAQLRRYTLATIEAAEQAANIAAVLESEPAGTETDEIEAMEEIEIARGSMLTVPAGTKMNQFKSEQPTATYEMFKHEILNEIGRCLNMPFNVVAANSSKYNYASGRLDWQVYFRSIRTIRGWIERVVLNRIFYAWLREAILIRGYLPGFGPNVQVRPTWFWPGAEHVDPKKEADAQEKRLRNLTSNLSNEYALQGKDWERELRQRAKEQKLLDELGLKIETAQPGGNKEKGDDDDDDEKDEDEKDEDEKDNP